MDIYKRSADPESNINKKEESIIIQFNKIYEYKVKHCDSVNVTLVSMKNRSDGLKVSAEYKKILKDFWGSSGDGREYIIKIVF